MWCVNQDIWNIFQTFVKYRYIFFFIFHKYFSSKILSAILKRHVYYNLKSKRYFLKTWSKPFLNSYFTIKSLTSSQKKNDLAYRHAHFVSSFSHGGTCKPRDGYSVYLFEGITTSVGYLIAKSLYIVRNFIYYLSSKTVYTCLSN